MGVSLTTVEALRAANHDAVHLRDEGLIRLPDIVAKALAEHRIVGDILAIARSEAPSDTFTSSTSAPKNSHMERS